MSKENIFLCLMKTDKEHQIAGKYNKIDQTYTGELDYRKVTVLALSSLAIIAGSFGFMLGTGGLGCFGCGWGVGVSAQIGTAFTAITGKTFTLSIALGMSLGSMGLLALGLWKMPRIEPQKVQLEHETEVRVVLNKSG